MSKPRLPIVAIGPSSDHALVPLGRHSDGIPMIMVSDVPSSPERGYIALKPLEVQALQKFGP